MKSRCLCLLLLISLLCGLSAIPAAAEDVEFLLNGSFESLKSDGTTLTDWSVLSGKNAYVTSVTTAKEGERAVKLYAEGESDNTRIIQRVEGLKPGASYVLTAYLYGLNTNGFAHIKVECGSQNNNSFQQKLGEWTKVEIKFTLGETISAGNIYIGAYNGAEVLWDAVSLQGPKGESSDSSPEEDFVQDITPPEGEVESVPVAEFVDGLSPMLVNGNFESGTNYPEGWSNFGGGTTQYTKDFGHESENCLMITNTQSTASPYSLQKVNIYGGGTYQIGLWLCIERTSTSAAYAGVKLEFYAKDSSALGEQTVKAFAGTDGKWMQFVFTFTAPPGTNHAYVFLRHYGLGTAWVDDVTLGCLVKPDAVSVTTDEVFYYSDRTEAGVATAVLQLGAYPELTGAAVDFRLKKDSTVLEEALSVPSIDGKAKFCFDVNLLSEKKAEYRVEVSVGEHTNFWRIYKYDRPVYLGADGVFRKNGKEIRPVIAYNYMESQYGYGLKDASINVSILNVPTDLDDEALVAHMVAKLDAAKEAGIMCLIATYSDMLPGGSRANRARTELLSANLHDHDALFGWMNMDEPFLHASDPHDDLRQTYISIRNNDPYHPVYTTEQATMLQQSGWYVDILGVDPYPGSTRAPETYPDEKVTAAIGAVQGRKPVYAVLQAFEWSKYFPTGDEMRNMLYQSFLAGADGLGYYRFTSSKGGKDLDETELWPVLSAFAQNEQKDAFDAFVYDKYPIFGDLRSKNYRAVSFVKDNALQVIVLNRKKEKQTVSVPLTNITGSHTIDAYTGECIFGSEKELFNGAETLSVELAPSAAVVYRITPAEGTALCALPDIRFSDCISAYASLEDLTYTGLNCSYGFRDGDLILQNAGTEAETVSVPVSAQFAEVINANGNAVLSGGIFSMQISGGDTVWVKFHETKPAGVYRGNVRYNKLLAGETYEVYTEESAITAVYDKNGERTELVGIRYNGETFTTPSAGPLTVKTFLWENMQPAAQD